MSIEEPLCSPYDWQLEITDARIFAGRRDELNRIKDELLRLNTGKHLPLIAVVGDRRVGKTSLFLRVAELCEGLKLLHVYISLDLTHAMDPWHFWNTLFREIKSCLTNAGVYVEREEIGFRPQLAQKEWGETVCGERLRFEEAYHSHESGKGSAILDSHIVEEDLRFLTKIALDSGFNGFVVMFDEAQVLEDQQGGSLVPRLIKQQLRRAIRASGKFALLFAGELELARIFTDRSEPFYLQGTTIQLGNFVNINDIVECAILPLDESKRHLISPMTVEYLGRMSQGKPNLIRFICNAIYERYRECRQDDLSITMEAMDDTIARIEKELSSEQYLRKQVDCICNLNSCDLEVLCNMTRYPNWSIKEVVELDESFRGERRSEYSIIRRERILEEKRDKFISMGLLADDSDRCTLAGGEFVALYSRFQYEVRKYGRLSKRFILGKGPRTPFAEKTGKLIDAITWELRHGPGIQIIVFHPDSRESGEAIIDKVKKRFSAFQKLIDRGVSYSEELEPYISECFNVCELVSRPGTYYLLCLTVRNLDNPRELMQIELYFDYGIIQTVNVSSLVNLLTQQATDARVAIEGSDAFRVQLLDLPGILDAMGGPNLDELLSRVGTVERWRIASVQHIVSSKNKGAEGQGAEDKDVEDDQSEQWIKLHSSGDDKEAEAELSRRLVKTRPDERYKSARFYNDRGYIRTSLKKNPQARKDLDMALDLHHIHLPLTMLNLSFLDIIEGNYEPAVQKIEDALLLSLSRLEIEAGYLKTILPECYLASFRVLWEQHPANLLEVSYINLAYALLKLKGATQAIEVLLEGLDLIPSSARLKHALARYYLFQKQAPLADPLFEQLLQAQESITDPALLQEIRLYSKFLTRKRHPRKK